MQNWWWRVAHIITACLWLTCFWRYTFNARCKHSARWIVVINVPSPRTFNAFSTMSECMVAYPHVQFDAFIPESVNMIFVFSSTIGRKFISNACNPCANCVGAQILQLLELMRRTQTAGCARMRCFVQSTTTSTTSLHIFPLFLCRWLCVACRMHARTQCECREQFHFAEQTHTTPARTSIQQQTQETHAGCQRNAATKSLCRAECRPHERKFTIVCGTDAERFVGGMDGGNGSRHGSSCVLSCMRGTCTTLSRVECVIIRIPNTVLDGSRWLSRYSCQCTHTDYDHVVCTYVHICFFVLFPNWINAYSYNVTNYIVVARNGIRASLKDFCERAVRNDTTFSIKYECKGFLRYKDFYDFFFKCVCSLRITSN